jgi:flagellar hook-basal body complex protein FliE
MISTNPAIQAALTQGLLTNPQVKAPSVGTEQGGDFGQQLMSMLKDVNSSQQEAKTKQEDLLTGRKPTEVQDVMIAMEKASTTMQLTLAVRNKMLDAYQEIEKLQV